jgi:hypothetical protein
MIINIKSETVTDKNSRDEREALIGYITQRPIFCRPPKRPIFCRPPIEKPSIYKEFWSIIGCICGFILLVPIMIFLVLLIIYFITIIPF